MLKTLWKFYKVQLLISITLGIVLIAVTLVKTPLIAAAIVLAAILGTFTLDLDYFFYTYFLEPSKDFSVTMKGFLKHKDFSSAINHMRLNEDEVEDKTLNSAFFQMLLALIAVLAVSSTNSVFVKTFIISTFANSIFRLTDYYFDGKAKEWFWALKQQPGKNNIVIYGLVLFGVLVYCISIF